MNPDVVTALKAADTPDKVQDIFAEAVAKKEAENKAEEEAEKVIVIVHILLLLLLVQMVLHILTWLKKT